MMIDRFIIVILLTYLYCYMSHKMLIVLMLKVLRQNNTVCNFLSDSPLDYHYIFLGLEGTYIAKL